MATVVPDYHGTPLLARRHDHDNSVLRCRLIIYIACCSHLILIYVALVPLSLYSSPAAIILFISICIYWRGQVGWETGGRRYLEYSYPNVNFMPLSSML
ncbi:hypothetical protein BKA93DRAFT_115540 [Sparassis latifolia]